MPLGPILLLRILAKIAQLICRELGFRAGSLRFQSSSPYPLCNKAPKCVSAPSWSPTTFKIISDKSNFIETLESLYIRIHPYIDSRNTDWRSATSHLRCSKDSDGRKIFCLRNSQSSRGDRHTTLVQWDRSNTMETHWQIPLFPTDFPYFSAFFRLLSSDHSHNYIFAADKEFLLYSPSHKIIRFVIEPTVCQCFAKNLVMVANIFLFVLNYFLFTQC